MPDPLVSVIMPTYNHAEFIGEALDSVIAQTYKNIEIIVIDNFSEDDTELIVSSKKDNRKDDRIKYIKFSNNGIIAASRNRGIEEAQGKYIAFIDSDDVWMKDKLVKQVEIAEQDDLIGLVSGFFIVKSAYPQDKDKIYGPKGKEIEGYIYDKLIKCNFITSSSVLIRKSVIHTVGAFDVDTNIICAEDFDLWLRIAKYYKVAFVKDPIGFYRKHTANASSNDERLKTALNVIDKHVKNKLASIKQGYKAKAIFYFYEGWDSILADPKISRKYLSEALKLDPANLKLFISVLAGLFFSFMPFLFRYIRLKKIDVFAGTKIINSQRL